jgi:hypothetical protein
MAKGVICLWFVLFVIFTGFCALECEFGCLSGNAADVKISFPFVLMPMVA